MTLPPVAKSVSSPPAEPVVSPVPRTRAMTNKHFLQPCFEIHAFKVILVSIYTSRVLCVKTRERMMSKKGDEKGVFNIEFIFWNLKKNSVSLNRYMQALQIILHFLCRVHDLLFCCKPALLIKVSLTTPRIKKNSLTKLKPSESTSRKRSTSIL